MKPEISQVKVGNGKTGRIYVGDGRVLTGEYMNMSLVPGNEALRGLAEGTDGTRTVVFGTYGDRRFKAVRANGSDWEAHYLDERGKPKEPVTDDLGALGPEIAAFARKQLGIRESEEFRR